MGWAGSELRASTAASTCSVKRGITMERKEAWQVLLAQQTPSFYQHPKFLIQIEVRYRDKPLLLPTWEVFMVEVKAIFFTKIQILFVSDQILQYRI